MLLKAAVKFYSVASDKLPAGGVGLIVPLSYMTRRNRLTTGTAEALRRAIGHKARVPQATLAFSNPSHGFEGSEQVEQAHKLALLGDTPHLIAGTCINSVTEAKAIRETVGFVPRSILIICGEVHARRARRIWRRVFPESQILVDTFPFRLEYQANHPFTLERRAWPWFMMSIVGHALFAVLGLKMRALRHYTGHKKG